MLTSTIGMVRSIGNYNIFFHIGIWSVFNNQRAISLRKEPEMAYKKPQIVAKSAAKQSFAAGCLRKMVYGKIPDGLPECTKSVTLK